MALEGFWPPLIASTIACLVTTVGILLIRKYEQWGRKAVTYFTCFAAGVLIAVPFLHIIPESLAMNVNAPLFLLAGFVAFHLTNRYLQTFVCHEAADIYCTIGLMAALGVGFHSFVDGVVYSVTFHVSTFTGVLTAIGMIFHEFPEGIVTFLLLLNSGVPTRKSAIYAFLAAGMSTPLGMLLSYPFISRLGKANLGAVLAVSAGTLLYVGATHLLPEAEREPRKHSVLVFFSGIAVALVIIATKGL